MINLTFGLFTQMSDSGPQGPLVISPVTLTSYFGVPLNNRNAGRGSLVCV